MLRTIPELRKVTKAILQAEMQGRIEHYKRVAKAIVTTFPDSSVSVLLTWEDPDFVRLLMIVREYVEEEYEKMRTGNKVVKILKARLK